MTMVPFWSPMLMPLRYVLGGATPAEVALSLGILLVSTIVLSRGAAAKIYRVGILMYGKRPSLGSWCAGFVIETCVWRDKSSRNAAYTFGNARRGLVVAGIAVSAAPPQAYADDPTRRHARPRRRRSGEPRRPPSASATARCRAASTSPLPRRCRRARSRSRCSAASAIATACSARPHDEPRDRRHRGRVRPIADLFSIGAVARRPLRQALGLGADGRRRLRRRSAPHRAASRRRRRQARVRRAARHLGARQGRAVDRRLGDLGRRRALAVARRRARHASFEAGFRLDNSAKSRRQPRDAVARRIGCRSASRTTTRCSAARTCAIPAGKAWYSAPRARSTCSSAIAAPIAELIDGARLIRGGVRRLHIDAIRRLLGFVEGAKVPGCRTPT